MPWTKENYPQSWKNFSPKVRNKAIEIGNALVEEEGMEDSRAIPIATSQAKSWAEKHGESIKSDEKK